MCRSFARLLRAPPIQHASPPKSGAGSCRHPSSRILPDRSITVTSASPSALLLTHVRHAARPGSSFHNPLIRLNALAGLARFSTYPGKLSASSSPPLTQNLAHDLDDFIESETVPMAVDPTIADAKPADILNGDVPEPAGRAEAALDPESDEEVPVDPAELQEALGRPPPVNSSYLPLPWKGRLGYVRQRRAQQKLRSFSVSISMLMIYAGLLEYLPPLLKSPRLLLSHMPHCFHIGESTSAPRSRSACTRHKEPPRS